jgi:tRNA G18 (ribose-2'-O)-methylase SpoU
VLIPVDSLDTPGLDDYRDLARPGRLTERGLFVAEGRLVVQRMIGLRSYRLRSLLLTDAAAAAMAPVLAGVPADVPIYVAGHAVMNGVVGFNIHRGCLALADRPPIGTMTATDSERADRVLALEGVNNPDNVGGLFRAGAALGAALVLLGPDCGDPLYRKAIRTSMGATLSLTYRVAESWPAALTDLQRAGLSIVACTPSPDAPSLYDVALPERAAVLVGAEGPGLSAGALALADLRVRIPMHGGLDSLNVTTAAAIVLSALDAKHQV